MTNLGLLLAMSLTDSIFSGYRAGAGRNPLLHKVDYTLLSFWSGLLLGLGGALVAAGGALAYLYWQKCSGKPVLDVIAILNDAALPLVRCYGVFATGVLLVMLFWTYPRRRTRELAVVLILGPCTLIRPFWIAGGAAWASLGVEPALAALIVLTAAVQFGVEHLLNRWQRRAQLLRMRQWM